MSSPCECSLNSLACFLLEYFYFLKDLALFFFSSEMLNRCLVVGCRRMVRGRARRRCPRARRRYPRLLLRSVFSCTRFSEKKKKKRIFDTVRSCIAFFKNSRRMAQKGELRRQEPRESAGRILLPTPLLLSLGTRGLGRGGMFQWLRIRSLRWK